MRNAAHFRNSLISGILNILYPSRCPVCSGASDQWNHAPICRNCWSSITRYAGPSCSVCALPLASEHARLCGQCLQVQPPFTRVAAYGLYEGVLAESIHQFKFHGVRRLAKPLGHFLLHLDIPNADGIVPVPLTKNGLIKRGFNQSLLLSRVVARHTGIRLFLDLLFKTRETAPQLGLSARDRLTNLRNAFTTGGNLGGLRLLLVDDVITTGATVRECAKTLLDDGAKEVTVLALARAPFG